MICGHVIEPRCPTVFSGVVVHASVSYELALSLCSDLWHVLTITLSCTAHFILAMLRTQVYMLRFWCVAFCHCLAQTMKHF